MLDGDPNWATTVAEIEVVVARSREAGVAAPVIVVHNVHWPFGRRDGYHAAAVPVAPLRRPAAAAGLTPGRSRPGNQGLRLVPFVALDEGGARNGVMTAVEDFVAGDRAQWDLVELPGFGGTAVLADQARVAHDPRLRGVLAALRAPDAVRRAGRRAEAGRIEAELRALALATDGEAALDALRARTDALERELTAATSRAERAERTPPTPAGADPAELEERITALLEEREGLHREVRELIEHRASHAAARWRIDLLEADLVKREQASAQLAAERDEQARASTEAQVRLEHAQSELETLRHALADATAALAESRARGEERALRITELADTERLLSGRVLHLEDSVGAAHAELADARAGAAELLQRVEHARRCDRQAAELLRATLSTRRARFAAAMRRAFGRPERGLSARLEAALALLDRDELTPDARSRPDRDPDSSRLTAR